MSSWIKRFAQDSNEIEGIMGAPTAKVVSAHEEFISLPKVTIGDLKRFVSIIQPDAVLRDRLDLNVRVGDHVAPRGGPDIVGWLEGIVKSANSGLAKPYDIHHEYETLHPFTDGNGRSGRVLFAWMLEQRGDKTLRNLSFLHAWYYLSLSAGR